jgi:hypothetical protein
LSVGELGNSILYEARLFCAIRDIRRKEEKRALDALGRRFLKEFQILSALAVPAPRFSGESRPVKCLCAGRTMAEPSDFLQPLLSRLQSVPGGPPTGRAPRKRAAAPAPQTLRSTLVGSVIAILVGWHRKVFVLHGTRKSRRCSGRPGVTGDIRDLIQRLSQNER